MKRILNLAASLLPTLVVVSILWATAPPTQAFGPFGILRPNTAVAPQPAPSYAEKYYYLNERYPKFYGGFHSSYYHNMGIPAGDLGIRGNGIYPTPW